MKRHVYDTEAELLTAYAQYFSELAQRYIKENDQFNVVLSGGSSPKRVYELLASPAFRNGVDWEHVYFFFGDERHVPADDARNNALMIDKALFQPLHIADDHVFKMDTALPPEATASHYMDSIRAHFRGEPIHFDLILLGLGDNAHTASLFPFTPVLHEKMPGVTAVYLKEDDAYRVTLTAPLINQAKNVAFLVFGANKAKAVREVIKGEKNSAEFPAQLIQSETAAVHWFLDNAAAVLL